MPNFIEFKLKKIPLNNNDKESFILCIVDLAMKNSTDNSNQGEREIVNLINSTISHEMRNPLNIVVGQTDIINM